MYCCHAFSWYISACHPKQRCGIAFQLSRLQFCRIFLAVTANALLEDMQKSKEAGMDEHLSKPVDISALEQVVKRFRVTPPENK